MQYFFIGRVRASRVLLGILGALLGSATVAFAAQGMSVDLERDLGEHLFINDADQTGLDIRGDMTLEAWVKPESAPPVGESYAIVSKSAGDINDAGFDFLYQTGASGGQFMLAVSANGFSGTYCTVLHMLPLDEWHHVAAVYDASLGTCEVFVDGVSVGSSGGLAGSIHDNGAPFRIGARGHTPAFFFDGKIDEVRVWNIVRSAEEIADLFNDELSGVEEYLIGYWRFDNDLLDASVQSNHLTASGDVVFSSDTPFLNEPEDDSGAWMVRQSAYAPIEVATPASPARPHDGTLRATRAVPATPAKEIVCVDDQCYHKEDHE